MKLHSTVEVNSIKFINGTMLQSKWTIHGSDLVIKGSDMSTTSILLVSKSHETSAVNIYNSTFGQLKAKRSKIIIEGCKIFGSNRNNITLLEIKNSSLNIRHSEFHKNKANRGSAIIKAVNGEVPLSENVVFKGNFGKEGLIQILNTNTLRLDKCIHKELNRNVENTSTKQITLVIIIPLLYLITLFVINIVVTCCKKKKKRQEPLSRRKKFDAFVCYCYDSDKDFVCYTILPEMEVNNDLRLCLHVRDFVPSMKIIDNIIIAVKNSNSAIIIMSRNFVNSKWCQVEFANCYKETMQDPAFKLFVIMMEPADKLTNLTECMKSFIMTKTYLQIDDPMLLKKITDYLKHVNKPNPKGATSTHDEVDKNLLMNNESVITKFDDNAVMDDEPMTTRFDDYVHNDTTTDNHRRSSQSFLFRCHISCGNGISRLLSSCCRYFSCDLKLEKTLINGIHSMDNSCIIYRNQLLKYNLPLLGYQEKKHMTIKRVVLQVIMISISYVSLIFSSVLMAFA